VTRRLSGVLKAHSDDALIT